MFMLHTKVAHDFFVLHFSWRVPCLEHFAYLQVLKFTAFVGVFTWVCCFSYVASFCRSLCAGPCCMFRWFRTLKGSIRPFSSNLPPILPMPSQRCHFVFSSGLPKAHSLAWYRDVPLGFHAENSRHSEVVARSSKSSEFEETAREKNGFWWENQQTCCLGLESCFKTNPAVLFAAVLLAMRLLYKALFHMTGCSCPG